MKMKPKGKRIATFMLAAAIVTHPIGTVAFAAAIPRFSDVASDHWAYPYIEDMVGQGFFTGTGLFYRDRGGMPFPRSRG